jgi:hypothetical protein
MWVAACQRIRRDSRYIHRIHDKAFIRQKDAVAPVSAGDIQGLATRGKIPIRPDDRGWLRISWTSTMSRIPF